VNQLVKAEDLAYGRWAEVLASAGMSDTYLSGKGVPCPLCGGTDRFQWVGKKYGGVYVCRHCTEGRYRSGMDLLMRHLNCEFKEAADHIRSHFGVNSQEQARRFFERMPIQPQGHAVADPQRALARMARHWQGCQPVERGDPVDLYLRRRVPGLQAIPQEIRLHPAMEYWDTSGDKPELVGKFPAMVVRGIDPDGQPVQLHKTYLTEAGHKANVQFPKKTDVGVGSNSFALRLGLPADGVLGVSEGIETALASSLLYGVTVWPCHAASVMANFRVPSELKVAVSRVWIFADNDTVKNGRRTGQQAALNLAKSLKSEGVRSLIRCPAKTGQDFDDVLHH